jgi:hypothetical protein
MERCSDGVEGAEEAIYGDNREEPFSAKKSNQSEPRAGQSGFASCSELLHQ